MKKQGEKQSSDWLARKRAVKGLSFQTKKLRQNKEHKGMEIKKSIDKAIILCEEEAGDKFK